MSARHYTVRRCLGCGENDPSTERCASGGGGFFGGSWRPRHTFVTICTECGAKGDELELPCSAAMAPERIEEQRGETPEEDRDAVAHYHGFRSWEHLLRANGLDT